MKKQGNLDFNRALEEKMKNYPGTDIFKEIIYGYTLDTKERNELMKDVYQSVYARDVNLLIKQRNKNQKRIELEEDEAEKLTDFKLPSKAPQKLSTLISSIAEKKRNKEKKEEEELKKGGNDNRFGTMIKRQKSPPIKKSLLETIYENKKLKEIKIKDNYSKEKDNEKDKDKDNYKNTKRNNKYRRNIIDKTEEDGYKNQETYLNSIANSTASLSASISKNNASEKEKESEINSNYNINNNNEEIIINKNRQNLVSGKPVSESLKTAADSRGYSRRSSNLFENINSNYISITNNQDLNLSKIFFVIIFIYKIKYQISNIK
jgi:hypothetical protein